MKQSISQTWGWDEAWQQNYFRQKFDPAKRQILQWQGPDEGKVDVGTISVQDGEDEIYLGLIELLPQYQGRGWGTAVIQELIQQAEQQNKRFTLHVLQTNHRARALYERLGLKIVEVEEYKFKMQFASPPAPD